MLSVIIDQCPCWMYYQIFEKVMYNRLIEFLETYKILVNQQFGFRKLHSSYMALMMLMDKLITALENNEIVIGIFLDFSKAFDMVDHKIITEQAFSLWYKRCCSLMDYQLLIKAEAVYYL